MSQPVNQFATLVRKGRVCNVMNYVRTCHNTLTSFPSSIAVAVLNRSPELSRAGLALSTLLQKHFISPSWLSQFIARKGQGRLKSRFGAHMLAPAIGRSRTDVAWAQTGSSERRILAISGVSDPSREQSSNISTWGPGFWAL